MARPIYRFSILTQPGGRKVEPLSKPGQISHSWPHTTQKGPTTDKGLIIGPLLQLPK